MHNKSYWLKEFERHRLSYLSELRELVIVEDRYLPSKSWVRRILVMLALGAVWRGLLTRIHAMLLLQAR